MLKVKTDIRIKSKIFLATFSLFLFFSILILANMNKSINLYVIQNKNESVIDEDLEEDPHPKNSALWAWLNLTNQEINGKRFYHNETVPIEGKLYNLTSGIPDYKVALIVDGKLLLNYNETTNSSGKFRIDYIIPFSMNIYSSHTIEAQIIESTPGDVDLENNFMIDANATSYLDVNNPNLNIPQLAGDFYNIPSYLRYDNNSGIPYQLINTTWFNKSFNKIQSTNFNTNSDGSFKPIPIPNVNFSDILYLNLTYIGNSTYINGTYKLISLNVYRNITCKWNTIASATEGNQITIRGQLFARNYSNLIINFTEIRLRMSGASIGSTTTDNNGIFNLTYSIPSGIVGSNIIEVELLNSPNINSNNTHLINIAAAPVTPTDDIKGSGEKTPPPFQNFFMVLIPIIVGIVAGFAVFAYFYLKKQEEESKIMKLPLEGRIKNLKILKETGRMEESLSYLFQSIYMELINGKYGRRIKENETIRDFAIISVRALNLNPATIYPFIQKVEEIIYARPFIISDKDFYETVELFSPIYFELTGYNFVLNF